VAGSDLTTALLKQVSRSFYLSVAVLPAAVRPTIGLAYLFARAADTIADTRLIERRARIVHLEALGEELSLARAGRIAAIVEAAAGSQSRCRSVGCRRLPRSSRPIGAHARRSGACDGSSPLSSRA
jgi:phytoene/squalene synthetase